LHAGDRPWSAVGALQGVDIWGIGLCQIKTHRCIYAQYYIQYCTIDAVTTQTCHVGTRMRFGQVSPQNKGGMQYAVMVWYADGMLMEC